MVAAPSPAKAKDGVALGDARGNASGAAVVPPPPAPYMAKEANADDDLDKTALQGKWIKELKKEATSLKYMHHYPRNP